MKTYTELTPQERNDLIAGLLGRNDGFIYDFSSDLNACHLVEEKMDEEHRWPYLMNLSRIVYGGSTASPDYLAAVWPHIHATASQKTEAILRAYNLIS